MEIVVVVLGVSEPQRSPFELVKTHPGRNDHLVTPAGEHKEARLIRDGAPDVEARTPPSGGPQWPSLPE